MIRDEKGFASLYAICTLLILSVLGMTAYMTVRKEMKASRHFVIQSVLQMEAQNGIIAAAAYLNGHPEKAASVGTDRPVRLYTLEHSDNGTECIIYARRQGEELWLLAQSTKEKQSARMYARIQAGEHGKYVISRWEH